MESQKLSCPNCKSDELVRIKPYPLLIWTKRKARCLVCGNRFAVTLQHYTALRDFALGEQHELISDKISYMFHKPMTAGQLVVLVCGILIFGTIAIYYGCNLILYTAIPLCWWIGRIFYPPIEKVPGKCPKCRYDMRGATTDRCSECGCSLNLRDIKTDNNTPRHNQ